MRKRIVNALIIGGLTVLGTFVGRAAEPTWEYSVQVSATVDAGQPKVTLSWPQDSLTSPSSYTVYRKSLDSANWGSGTTLSGATTTYTDTGVQLGGAYEYAIHKATATHNGYGYISVGVNAPLVDRRGKVVLVVDASQAGALANELKRLQDDLVGDGWTVVRHDVNRNDSAANVKNLIRSTYQADPANVRAVFLFGHVPVPYSGNIVPDGHFPDHQGAWPADAYYGDMDGSWTDNSVYNTAAHSTRNHNVPGDGKFDQSTMPSAIELQVGRVDLANMPGRKVWGGPATFPNETELLRQYLNKDHNFRHKKFSLPRRALVHDSFGSRGGEAFAASAFRSYAPLLGAANVTSVEKGVWIPTLGANSYLMAYGCGGGSYSSIVGLGNTGPYQEGTTVELVEADIKSVFTMLMGSWLGDWDTEDNIMRGVLATRSHGLACSWSGRPHWFYHHLGLGETLGYSARMTQNNGSGGLYKHEVNNSAGGIHVGLLGDPTLRLHPVAPASNLQAVSGGNGVNLTWNASADGVVGYHVYRAASANGPFTRVTTSPVTQTSYTDASPAGATTYMLRAVKLENTTSGSYYNGSQGIFATVNSSGGGGSTNPVVSLTLNAPPANATVGGTTVTISASPSASVLGVQFKVDGANIGAEDTSAPHSITWDSTTVANGPHALTAVARVAPGVEVASGAVNVNVNNTTGGGGEGNTNGSNNIIWMDDALPAGAVAPEGTDGGDPWTWISANPAPAAGGRALQSFLRPGLHQNYFYGASQTLTVGAGDTLYAYVYLDPVNLPRQIMLQWCDGSWEHRAYWGEDLIGYGTKDTISRRNMGALPAAGQWVRLEVPASAVGLEGKSLSGMAFSLLGGRANWDAAGKYSGTSGNELDLLPPEVAIAEPANNAQVTGTVRISATATDNVGVVGVQYKLDGVNLGAERTSSPYSLDWNATTVVNGSHTLTAVARDAAGNQKTSSAVLVNVTGGTAVPTRVDRLWIDDALPAGAKPATDGGDGWNWISANPAPHSGASAHQSTASGGLHQHYFSAATSPMAVAAGDVLFSYVYLDPASPPTQVMLQWNDGSWEHRAYWGADQVLYGVKSTESRRPMGALPAVGQWVRLEVPAKSVGLEGKTVTGMAFTLYGGRAAWDAAGVNTTGATNSQPNNTNGTATGLVWVDDRLPAGAVGNADGGDGWNWISANPAPFFGAGAHQSSVGFGLHQHYFDWATQTMEVGAGDTLYAYVHLDPANVPSQIMLQWNDGSWEHRAYWGANRIQYGFDNTISRRNMGALPPAGQWVRLEVPAASVGLEGRTVRGMAFSVFDGRVTWDAAGKGSVPETGTNQPGTVPGGNPGGLPVVTVVASAPNAAEQASVPGEFKFSRSGATTEPLTVQFALTGSATAASDYTGAAQSITIPNGATTATLAIQPVDDAQAEALETVLLGLTASSSYAVGVNSNATITIADNDSGSSTNPPAGTNGGPEISVTDYTGLRLPKAGDHTLHVLSPTLLELQLVTKKDPDPAPVPQWNFVDVNNQFHAPSLSEFHVTVDGTSVPVQAVGFKRRALFAPIATRDLRVVNCLYLKIGRSVGDNQKVEVKNPSGGLWSSGSKFEATSTTLRYSPAIHVNQEGYVPAFAKKAMIGYFTGSLGEMDIPVSAGFKLVESTSGAEVFQGALKSRADVGFTYTPTPYQKVYEADFTAFKQPGEYRLVVPGLGASLPFLIDDGIVMGFARTYALGMYHQRCGGDNKLPFTRHEHANCHLAPADVPLPQTSFPFTWNCVASKTVDAKDNPRHTAARMTDEGTQMYPIINRGKLDVSGGHHDAGDYSKYTINSAALTHYLTFAVDSLAGVAALDNLGLPNSGDGISDILQEAKWEADYLAKIQDADGGFYFLVYPKEREYEWGVTPDNGDPQVVWPKNTAVTAAAVAALAQTASSPKFKQHYPQEAAKYLEKAKLGWQFLMNAIARYGKDGAYQKLTHYGHEFLHDDELAWAACEMFLATGEEQYHQKLKEWFNPSDPATLRWGWWRLYEAWGAAIRSYAFAARSGRLPASRLDAAYLAKCEEQVVLCAQDQVARSRSSAYGTSFPLESKAVKAAGWYFASERAFDMAVGYQIQPKPEFIEGILANLNYEGGCNPVNVAFVSGLGWKRQRDVVHQYALADHRTIAPSGIPIGGFTSTSPYSEVYKGELRAMDYPDDEAGTGPYPMYDRWADSWNVVAEFVHLDQARSLASLAFLATLTPVKDEPWKSANARIIAPETLEIGKPNTVTVQVEGKDLNGARIVWEARDMEPGFGREFVVTPKSSGDYWIEAEIQWPDGCRAFARHSAGADGSLVVWVDDELPAGATGSGSGGDIWKWVSTPAPQSGESAHESSAAAGMHQHWFTGAGSTLKINAGDKLFAYVYLDPANPPTEIMLQWDDGSWDHRAYWGANQLTFGSDNTVSRRYMGPLPTAGQWVKLEVPASAVGLEGKTLRGMAFTLFNGRAFWDSAGRSAE